MDKPFKKLTDRQKISFYMVQKVKKLNLHSHNVMAKLANVQWSLKVTNNINRRYHDSPSELVREMMSKYMTELPCETCHGKRLSRSAIGLYCRK